VDGTAVARPVLGGEAVSNRNWSYAIAETGTEDAFGENLGVMTRPYAVSREEAQYADVGGTAAALGGWNLAVSRFSDRQEEALQVLEAFATEDVMLTVFELVASSRRTSSWSRRPVRTMSGPSSRYADVVQSASENAIPRPATDLWPGAVGALIYQEVNAAYRGEKHPRLR